MSFEICELALLHDDIEHVIQHGSNVVRVEFRPRLSYSHMLSMSMLAGTVVARGYRRCSRVPSLHVDTLVALTAPSDRGPHAEYMR